VRVVTTTQRDEAWRLARCGYLCASDAADMLAKIKTGEAAARRDLKLRLVCERLTNQPQEDAYVNASMQRGLDKEAEARLAYESLTGHLVQDVGFLAHDTLLAGCSPDGAVDGFTRLVEIKVPKTATHIGYLRAKKVPSSYLAQLTHQLWITGADAVDFFSWDDRLAPGLQMFLATLNRNEVDLAAWELSVRLFLTEVEQEMAAVQGLMEAVHA
jgi:predicted phage-related endonuclease